MSSVYPPHGPQDVERFRALKQEDRDYFKFALEFCSLILDARPRQAEALEVAANHLTALGYYTDGLLLDQRLVQLRPGDPNIHYNLACSFSLVGRPEDALYALNKAIEHGYRDHRHIARDDDLAALRHNPKFQELLIRLRKMAED